MGHDRRKSLYRHVPDYGGVECKRHNSIVLSLIFGFISRVLDLCEGTLRMGYKPPRLAWKVYYALMVSLQSIEIVSIIPSKRQISESPSQEAS